MTSRKRPEHGAGRIDAVPADQQRESTATVTVALVANLAIAVAKTIGGLVSGSSALLSEAAHSVADGLNEVFLLAALVRSQRRADPAHPFGYGKERFFWSLLAALGIFTTGACFSAYQGLQALRGHASGHESFTVVYVILLVSLAAESTSLAKALRQIRHAARARHRSMLAQLRDRSDPTVRTVTAEDGVAILGIMLAAAGVLAHQATGTALFEGLASLGIAALLAFVAYRLGRDAQHLLIGAAADRELTEACYRFLFAQPEIDIVLTVLTMQMGPQEVLLAARVDLADGLDSSDAMEAISGRIKKDLHNRFPQLGQVFLDITDATDEDRRRARQRLDSLTERGPR
jgi:cation diffusion facilitator family transporter